MTTHKDLLIQARDALEGARRNMLDNAPHLSGKVWGDADAAIASLQAAIDAPEEPWAIKEVVVHADYREMWRQVTKQNQELCAALSQSCPAPAKPLTIRQIAEVTGEFGHVRSDYTIGIARAIEAAHGIGVKL